MRKLILIVMALVVALGGMGVTYACWTSSWFVRDYFVSYPYTTYPTCYESPCADPFRWVVSNDDGVESDISPYGVIDPGDDGTYTEYSYWNDFSSSNDPGSYPVPTSPPGIGDETFPRYTKDVAKTVAYLGTDGPCDPDPDTQYITVEIDNAYPYYYPTVFFNIGCPEAAQGTIMNIVLEEFAPGSTTPTPGGIPELTITYSGIYEGMPIPMGGEVWGALHILVNQSAEQNTSYKLRLSIDTQCDLQECDTAYAYGGCKAKCFLTLPNLLNNNWGWTNGPLYPSCYTYKWDIYAGAAQCNLYKGTKVGWLTVNYTGTTMDGTVTVTYHMYPGYDMQATHLYIGKDYLPKDSKGRYINSPGQFPYQHVPPADSSVDTYVITGVRGPIYIAAHADVCWFR